MADEQDEKSHLGALWEIGMFKPYDVVVVVLLLFIIFTTVLWGVFKKPELFQFVVPLMLMILVLMVWVVSLVFRCIWFIVKTWADIKMLPVSAGRLAVAFARGADVPGVQPDVKP